MDIIVRFSQPTIVMCLLAAAITLVPGKAAAQAPVPIFVYSVVFLCGTLAGPDEALPGKEGPVKPANYATAINVHNFLAEPVGFTKKAVITNPQGQQRGRISPKQEDRLKADEALEIDCPDIVKLLAGVASDLKFIKGFVVVESKTELDVVAISTARSVRPAGTAASGIGFGFGIDVNYISPKRKP